MSTIETYDERAVVLAYADAQRPPYPHEDFRQFRQARLRALEAAYGIEMSWEGVKATPLKVSLGNALDARNHGAAALRESS